MKMEQVASQDLIRSGRAFVEQTGLQGAQASQIAGAIRRKIVQLGTHVHRLHVLYLAHDLVSRVKY